MPLPQRYLFNLQSIKIKFSYKNKNMITVIKIIIFELIKTWFSLGCYS